MKRSIAELLESDAMKGLVVTSLLTSAVLIGPTTGVAQTLKVGAAAEVLTADDAMVIGGGIGPGKATARRASCGPPPL